MKRNERAIALLKFESSIQRSLIRGKRTDSPVKRRWRRCLSTVHRFSLFYDAGLVPRAMSGTYDLLFEAAVNREREAHAEWIQEKVAAEMGFLRRRSRRKN